MVIDNGIRVQSEPNKNVADKSYQEYTEEDTYIEEQVHEDNLPLVAPTQWSNITI